MSFWMASWAPKILNSFQIMDQVSRRQDRTIYWLNSHQLWTESTQRSRRKSVRFDLRRTYSTYNLEARFFRKINERPLVDVKDPAAVVSLAQIAAQGEDRKNLSSIKDRRGLPLDQWDDLQSPLPLWRSKTLAIRSMVQQKNPFYLSSQMTPLSKR